MKPFLSPRFRRNGMLLVLLVGGLWLPAGQLLSRGGADAPAGLKPPDRPLTPERCHQLSRWTPEEVRKLLGPPRHISRQLLYHRYLEQWLYEQPYQVRVEVDFTRGKQPHLQSVQPLPAPGP
jgi:hypothetical protein